MGVLVISALLFSVLAYSKPSVPGPQGPQGPQGLQGEQGPAGSQGVAGKDAEPTFGAASGAQHFQKESFLQGVCAGGRDQFCLSSAGAILTSASTTFNGTIQLQGGVFASATSSNFTSATTTPCSLQNPFAATSTLSMWRVAQTTDGNSPNAYEFAVTPSRYASSTAFGAATYAAGAQGVTIATSSVVVPPNYWVVIKNATSSVGANTPTGTCRAVFIK